MQSVHAECMSLLCYSSGNSSTRESCGSSHLKALRTACMQSGVKSLAHLLSRAGMDNLLGVYEGAAASHERDEAKKLDVIAVRPFPSCTL